MKKCWVPPIEICWYPENEKKSLVVNCTRNSLAFQLNYARHGYSLPWLHHIFCQAMFNTFRLLQFELKIKQYNFTSIFAPYLNSPVLKWFCCCSANKNMMMHVVFAIMLLFCWNWVQYNNYSGTFWQICLFWKTRRERFDGVFRKLLLKPW